jgi:hypothetical protein
LSVAICAVRYASQHKSNKVVRAGAHNPSYQPSGRDGDFDRCRGCPPSYPVGWAATRHGLNGLSDLSGGSSPRRGRNRVRCTEAVQESTNKVHCILAPSVIATLSRSKSFRVTEVALASARSQSGQTAATALPIRASLLSSTIKADVATRIASIAIVLCRTSEEHLSSVIASCRTGVTCASLANICNCIRR